MATACDNIPCDVDLENLLIKINSFLTELDAIRQLCTDAKASCENRVKTLEDELDALDESIDERIQTLKDFLITELKKISDCACGLKTDVELAATDISRIIQKLKDSNSITVVDGVATKWNNIWDPSTSGDFLITGDQIKDGSISTEKFKLGEIVEINSFGFSEKITAVSTSVDGHSVSNTNSVGTYTVSNSSTVAPMKTMFTLSCWFDVRNLSDDEEQRQDFIVFIDDTIVFDFGWTPSISNAQSANFVYTIPPNSSAVVDIRTVKTSTSGINSLNVAASYIGIKN